MNPSLVIGHTLIEPSTAFNFSQGIFQQPGSYFPADAHLKTKSENLYSQTHFAVTLSCQFFGKGVLAKSEGRQCVSRTC